MAEILSVFTPDQLVELAKNKIIADGVGITNFNVGGITRDIVETMAVQESMTGMDYIEGLRQSVPVALYDGLDFTRKNATKSSGFFRFYRLPEFTMTYTGSGTSCSLTITDSDLTTTVTGASGDDLSLSFSTYTTISALVTAINGHGSYTATLVGAGAQAPADLANYSGEEIVGSVNYKDATDSFDVVLDSLSSITVPTGTQVSVNGVIFITTASGTIDADSTTTGDVAAQANVSGTDGNIAASDVDTFNGKGVLNSSVSGVEHVINDSAFTGGTDKESDQDRAERFKTFVQGLGAGTVLGIEAAILNIDEIKSVKVRTNHPQRGQITVVADDGTGTLSSDLTDEIRKVLDGDADDIENYPGERAAGITANITAPSVTSVNVTVTITRIGTLSDTTEIETAAQTAIENYVNSLRLGHDVIVSTITQKVKNSHPAIYDAAVSAPSANVSISDSNVARTGAGTGGTVSITINTLTALP